MNAARLLRELGASFWDDLTGAFSLRNWQDCLAKLSITSRKQLIENLLGILPQVAIFYLVLAPVVAMPLYNKMLFFPLKQHAIDFAELAGIAKVNVQIVGENSRKLSAWYFPVDGARGAVIISHGNGGNISHRGPLIELLLRQKMSVLAYDYQGYGESEGEPSIDNICRDGLAAYDYLVTQKGVKPEKIVLYGESLGGGVAAHVASKRQVGAVILQSTFASLPHVARQKMLLMRLYPDFLFPKNKLDTAGIMAEPHAPLLIVHGKADSIIPFTESELLYKKAVEPKQLVAIESANHNDMYDTYVGSLEQAVAAFLDRLF